MNKVYQTNFSCNKGNCMQANYATLLNLDLNDVPNLIEIDDEINRAIILKQFLKSYGYEIKYNFYNPMFFNIEDEYKDDYGLIWNKFNKDTILKYKGINGYFDGIVLSPKFFKPYQGNNYKSHAVIINKKYEIIHDPNPEYKDLKTYPYSDILGFNGVIGFSVIEKI